MKKNNIYYKIKNIKNPTSLCIRFIHSGFFLGTPVSFINEIDCHDIAKILLKVALNTITLKRYYHTVDGHLRD
jgi:hypothetical protein